MNKQKEAVVDTMPHPIQAWEVPQQYPTRLHDTAIIVGFANTTRQLVPWDRTDVDFVGVNEEYNYDWFKKTPSWWFQIHPRWDWTRTNNMNHYNHPNWVMNRETKCIRCAGEGKLPTKKEGEFVVCPECEHGIYKPPAYRQDLEIVMQQHWDDVAHSIAYPLKEAASVLPLPYTYLTSSIAMMLVLCYLMGYKRVELYGFEMGTTTEYHYQRSNFEFVCGVLMTKGMEIYLPDQSPLLKGELYGFKNMKTGYRQNLEMRLTFLNLQESSQSQQVQQMTGEIRLLQELVNAGTLPAARLEARMKDYTQAIGTHNIIKGAIAEVKNMTSLYDKYFTAGTEAGNLSAEDYAVYTNAAYTGEESA